MGKCLVTKLAGVVNNGSLLKLGELRITVEATTASQVLFQLNGVKYSCNVDTIAGTVNVPANTVYNTTDWTNIKSKNAGKAVFTFIDKYNLSYIHSNLDVSIIGASYLTKCIQFTFKSNLGDLISLADLSNSPALTTLTLSGNITGDLADLNKCPALTTLTLSGNITGDLAVVSSKMALVNITSINTFTWSYRESSNTLFSILSSPKVSNIDKMLQDLSTCKAATADALKQITATGTRTSASYAAIQILQSKGYTVSIRPV